MRFYSDRGFKGSQCFLGPPGREPGWGPRDWCSGEERRELQLGQTEPHCSPCSISAAAQAEVPPSDAANELMAPPCSVYRCLPPQGSSGFANMRDHMLPGDGCSHLQAAKGRNWGPQWGREAFGLSKPRRGARRAGRCWVPTGLSGYQAAFVLSNLLLTGIKPLDFSLPETAAAFHLPLRREAGARDCLGRAGASDPQPHLFRQFCQQWQERGRGGLELGKHCHILENVPWPY